MQTGVGLNIDSFRSKFITGSRSYLFYMTPQFPPNLPGVTPNIPGGPEMPTYLVRATTLPSSSFDELTASWQGFDYKAAGKRTYDTWNVTFTVDVNALIRQAFVLWQDAILDPRTNVHAMPGNAGYMANQKVALINLNFTTESILYELIGAYPSTVGEVTLDYADSAYATFDVTFTYQYFLTNVGGLSPQYAAGGLV